MREETNIIEKEIQVKDYLTKSKLILRDLDLLKQMKSLTVSMSINTLDEDFKNDMDNASSIQDRLDTLKELYNSGIHTVLFMSPIFPYITNFKEIIEFSKDYIDEYWFENLNLRGDYKAKILFYIQEKYPKFIDKYKLQNIGQPYLVKIKIPIKELGSIDFSSLIGKLNRFCKDYTIYGEKHIPCIGKTFKRDISSNEILDIIDVKLLYDDFII